ncbi:MAG: arsenical pump rane protein [Pseudonocardiales bacterium]|nr:arsenical pump rane protein [Pseudonocardiales bacterium]
MPGAAAETIAVALLVISLAFAVLRPRGLTEAVVAVPAAGLLVVLGIVPADDAGRTLREIGPTVGFLAAILVFGHLCAEAGVFAYLGSRAARASRGEPRRLLGLVVALAAGVTATLTLDATVVLLTPVVLTTVATMRVAARPHAYACTRLANSGSLLLPVSNLTNLLAFGASGLSFGRFTALMLLPWVLVCAAEWGALRMFFRRDLVERGSVSHETPPAPRYALGVLAVTVSLFVIASSVHVSPAWAALVGCVALLVPRVARRDVRVPKLLMEASPGFCAFVLALAIVVDGVTRHGLENALRHVVPSSTSFLALLGLAAAAAVLANLVNNLPATLALAPIVAGHPAWVLAVLLGVNIGPNATYPGSLATLLWRRLLPADVRPRAAEFHLFGLLTVPALLALATAALWASVTVVGV